MEKLAEAFVRALRVRHRSFFKRSTSRPIADGLERLVH